MRSTPVVRPLPAITGLSRHRDRADSLFATCSRVAVNHFGGSSA
jgi:hypothetical protein